MGFEICTFSIMNLKCWKYHWHAEDWTKVKGVFVLHFPSLEHLEISTYISAYLIDMKSTQDLFLIVLVWDFHWPQSTSSGDRHLVR